MGEELRRHKDALGGLVSLENGKIQAEGLGEVQEMIDIADFAVGQSRMLYGLAMHSERPQHRMYEQWHPLGVVGIISAFNFPVAVWAWNAFLAAICGNVSVWKPSPKTPLTAIAVQQICNRVLRDSMDCRRLRSVHRCRQRSWPSASSMTGASRCVSFTGSTPVGRKVGEACRVASRQMRCWNSAATTRSFSTHPRTSPSPCRRSYSAQSAPQASAAPATRRVIVHRDRLAELERQLVSAYAQVRIGDPLDSTTR